MKFEIVIHTKNTAIHFSPVKISSDRLTRLITAQSRAKCNIHLLERCIGDVLQKTKPVTTSVEEDCPQLRFSVRLRVASVSRDMKLDYTTYVHKMPLPSILHLRRHPTMGLTYRLFKVHLPWEVTISG